MNAFTPWGKVAGLTGGSIVTVFIALYALVRAEKALNREEQLRPIPMEAQEDLPPAAGGDARAGDVFLPSHRGR
jgi:hypothetical protein